MGDPFLFFLFMAVSLSSFLVGIAQERLSSRKRIDEAFISGKEYGWNQGYITGVRVMAEEWKKDVKRNGRG
jgi:hypothetical protein